MRAGQLRHKITIQQVTETPDSFNQPIQAWGDYAERAASITPLEGRELWATRQTWPEAQAVITLRGDVITSAITTKMRVKYDDPKTGAEKIYNILAALDLEERGSEIKLICRKEG